MDILNTVLIVLVSHCVGETSDNLAFQKPATSSSLYYKIPSAAPSVAVDFRVDTCTLSNADDSIPWWMVDLQRQFLIHSVMLTNTGVKNYWERLRNFVIEIFTENPLRCSSAIHDVCATHSEPPLGNAEARNFTCVYPVTGRFVRIRKWKKNYPHDLLTLCDVKVFGMEKTGCSSPILFPKTTGFRMTSQTLKIINNVSSTECAKRCHSNGICDAFNYNLDLQTCELVLDPRFEDEVESNNAWSYYGLDLC